MNTTKRTTVFGVNKRIAKVVHNIMLFGMLHSTFVAPAQIILLDYFHASKPPVTKWGTFYGDQRDYINESQILENEAPILPFEKTVNEIEKEVKVNEIYYSDIEQGLIGVFSDKPLDDAKDNLFKLNILNIPRNAKGYLKYDLYGVEGVSSVSRSINDLPSTGGHIIKKNNAWSSQVEEIDINWLKAGENTILFTAPSIKGFGYKVKNLRVEFTENISFASSMVLGIDETALMKKENKIYIKGFINNAKKDLRVEIEGIPLSVYQNQFEGVVELSDKMLHKTHLLVTARDNNGVLGQEVIPLVNLTEADLLVPFEMNSNASVKMFPAFLGSELYTDGAGIIVPDSALVERKNISISKLRKKDMPPLNSGMINVTKDGAAFRFLPDGTKFQKEAKILLEYDLKLIPSGYSEKDIKTFYFNTKSKSWVSVERDSVDLPNRTIISNTDHFTDYINGIIQTPETPESSAFIPTMMSDIQAADPSAGITLIAPPEVSQKGSAGISYPIKVPAGRKGMQPNLAIQYNSDGGNGFLGQGWDISVPAITIDTRWGVPILDDEHETEIYTLNGEQLMYPKIKNTEGQMVDWMPNRHYDATSDQNIYSTVDRDRIDDAVFTPRKQGSFAKIERLGTNPTNYYWKVTDTNGTISWYGGNENGVVLNTVIKNSEDKIVHWGLYKVQDVFGNNIIYDYYNTVINSFSGVNSNLNGGRVFIINTIRYTGYNNTPGDYTISFLRNTTNLKSIQEINARLGIKIIEPYLLDKIRVHNKKKVIREYRFNYNTFARFGKTLLTKVSEHDSGGNEFYKHEFEYYDDLLDDNGNEVYFSSAIDVTICNDEIPPSLPCTGVWDLARILFMNPTDVYINNQLLPGSPFNSSTDFINALLSIYPEFEVNYWPNTSTITSIVALNPSTLFENITFIDPLSGTYSYDFGPCNSSPSSGSSIPSMFSSIISNFNISYSGIGQTGDPDCPDFLNYDFSISGIIPSFNSSGAILGSTKSKNYNVGGHLGFGVDFQWNPTTKNITIGGGYNHSWDESESLTAMIDINGDGLEDVVYKSPNGKIYWKKHFVEKIITSEGEEVIEHSFENYAPITSIDNYVDDFYKSYGESSSFNLQANFGFSGANAFAGWNTSKNKSKTKVYFTDVNSDGLMDIVKNGRVFFNRLDQNGNPYFEPESKLTENMLIEAAPVTVNITEPEIVIESPGYDVVKVWEAPADGKIIIYNQITKNSNQQAVVTIEMKKPEDDGIVECGGYVNSTGGQGYQVFDVDFGTDVGFFGIDYNAYSVPDKFDIIWNGQLYSTGYVGHNSQDGALVGLGISQNEINTGNPSTGAGVLTFEKNLPYPTTAQVIVTAPLGGTLWTLSVICPDSIYMKPAIDSFTKTTDIIGNFELSIDLKEIKNQNFKIKSDNTQLEEGKWYSFSNISLFIEDFETTFPNSQVVSDNERLTMIINRSSIEFNKLEFIYEDNSSDIFYFTLKDVQYDYNNLPPPPPTVDPICQFEPSEMCLLFGAKLTSSGFQQINETITNFSSACHPQHGLLRVKKGDRIYFRTHSIGNGNPRVSWNPKIKYHDSTLNSITDENGIKPYESEYAESFILSQEVPIVFPGNGEATISWVPFDVVNPTDQLVYSIIRRDFNGSNFTDTSLFSQDCLPNVTTTVSATPILNNILVSGNTSTSITQFLFRVFSTSNVNWKEILWQPEILLNTEQTITGNNNSNEGTVNVVETRFPIVEYSIYKNFSCGYGYNTLNVSSIDDGVTDLIISPDLTNVSFNSTDNGTIYFVVKKNNTFVGRRIIQVTNGNVSILPGTINLGAENENIEVGFYTDDSKRVIGSPTDVSLLNKIVNNSSNVIRIDKGSSNFYFSADKANLMHKPFQNFGPMYRQWGQFLYNPDNVSGALLVPSLGINLIKEEVLTITDAQATALHNSLLDNNNQINSDLQLLQNIDINAPNAASTIQSTLESIQSNSGSSSFPFITANAHKDSQLDIEGKWIGYHRENYANSNGSRAARLNQSVNFEEDNTIYSGTFYTGAYGIDKHSYGEGESVSAGGGYAGFGASGTSSLGGTSKLLTDFIDLNGDGYPDIVTTEQVQFSKGTGGLLLPVSRGTNNGDMSLDKNGNWGFSASGSFGKSGKRTPGGEGTMPPPDGTLRIGKPGTSSFGKGNNSLGLSGSFGKGDTETHKLWADFNGDGLPDIITKNSSTNTINVKLNFGNNSFSTNNNWVTFPLAEGKSETFGGGLGFNYANGSIEAGISLGRTDSDTETTLIDLNGDGLLDKLSSNSNSISVDFSLGNKFNSSITSMSHDFSYYNSATTTTEGINVTGTYSLIWPLYLIFVVIPLKIPDVSVTASTGNSTNRTKKTITDFDKDGYPDLIEEISNTEIRVYHSRIKRTNKLKSVTNPLGGKFTVDYKVHKVDYDNPNPKWAMSSVMIEDGYDGLVNDGHNMYKKEFVYENPRYDRRERDFYGFETVKTIDYTLDENGEQDEVYRTSVTKYHNRSYFLNGLVKETAVYKGDMANNELYSKSENTYEIRRLEDDNNSVIATAQGVLAEDYDVGGSEGRRSAAVFMTKTKSYVYELGSSPLISESEMVYDQKGRVTEYKYLGAPGNNQDDYTTEITYHSDTALENKNIISVPAQVLVKVNNQVKRKRQTDNIDLSTGMIQTIKHFYTANDFAKVDLKYDQFGNIAHIEYPENDNSERMSYTYEYDIAYNKHVTKVTDAFGYSSETEYDFKFDVPLEVTDIAGNKTRYTYDTFGRMTEVLGPKEMPTSQSYTIKFEYFPKYSDIQSLGFVSQNEFVPVAQTMHYDPQHPNNTIDTYTFIDGLARPVQVKKDITVNLNSSNPSANPNYEERMSVSGAVVYDEFGRAVKQYHPVVENKSNTVNFKYNPAQVTYHTQSIYDPLDRVVETVDEAQSQAFMEYSVDGNLHKTRSVVQQTGSVNIISESFKDVNGRVVKTNNVGPQGDIITLFDYNAIGELLSYTDDMSMTTGYKYDMLGRKTTMSHPDRGETHYYYDKASNLTRLETANLSVQGQYISYHYEYNRLKGITFPEMTPGVDNLSNVLYEYGIPSSGNQTGRLIFQKDASGIQEFEYGNMGEMVYNRRTVVAPSPTLPSRTFETHFEYDSWNRLQEMTYPDGETVKYSYDLGGNLNEIQGDMTYVQRIDYNHYGERTYIKYGNGTETIYSYTPELRRLDNLRVLASNNETLLNNSYEYDKVGNVENITNLAGFNQVNFMGGGYQHSYRYDNLNRLVYARGGFTGHPMQYELGNDYSSDYETSMVYNSTHGIVNKLQNHNKNGQTFLPNTYDNHYEYYENTHRVKQIIDAYGATTESFVYDLNGNIIQRNDDATKYYFWDEADRLRVLYQGDELLHHYVYDAGGQRVLKASSYMEAVYENGQLVDSNIQMGNYTSYPSAFLVVDPDGIYSKHYYAGTQRIAARIGDKNADELFEDKKKSAKLNGTDSTDNTFNPEELKTLQQKDLQFYLDKAGKVARLSFKKYKSAESEVQEQQQENENNYVAYGAMAEELIYYYHPDHLGTATYLTDINGEAYEFFLNLPFGETMAEQHSQTADYVNRWKFTGHELDRETGLYYANARYYDPKRSIWLSVDPLAEQFPSWNPYHYVHQNPINLIDPTGMSAYPPGEEELANLGISLDNIENGYQWSDSDGNWSYNNKTKTWEGINGTDVNIPAETQQIEAVEITNLNWFQRNFVLDLSLSGSIGAQVGLKGGIFEGGGGLVSTEIGTANLDLTRMSFSKSSWGDGTINNYLNGSVGLSRSPLSAGYGVNHSYSSLDAMYGDGLMDNGKTSRGFIGGVNKGKNLLNNYKPFVAQPGATYKGNDDFYGLNLGVGAKVFFGIEINFRIGLKKKE